MDDVFGQASRALEDGATGAQEFTPVLRWLTTNLGCLDTGVTTPR